MRQNYYRNYVESEILSADPLELVCLLYRGAIEGVAEARQCVRRGDIAGRSAAASRATAIVNELLLRVDRQQGGEIAANLIELYTYVARCLNEGNFRQAEAPFEEAEQVLRTLADAWAQCRPVRGSTTAEEEHYEPVSCAG